VDVKAIKEAQIMAGDHDIELENSNTISIANYIEVQAL
jgi:hypothetical protein